MKINNVGTVWRIGGAYINAGNANLPIGGIKIATQKNGVPRELTTKDLITLQVRTVFGQE